jgi:hypothetical protein
VVGLVLVNPRTSNYDARHGNVTFMAVATAEKKSYGLPVHLVTVYTLYTIYYF